MTSKVTEESVSNLIGTIGSNYLNEKTGSFIKNNLDGKGKDDKKNKFLFLIKMVFLCLIQFNWLRSQDITTFTEKYVNTNTEVEKE